MLLFAILYLLFSLIGIVYTSDKAVTYAEKLAEVLHFSPFVVGATVLALGTSLPELVTVLMAIFTSEFISLDVFTGIVFGSNIANLVLILPLTYIFSSYKFIKSDRFNRLALSFATLYFVLALFLGHFLFGLLGVLLYIFYLKKF